MRRPWIEPRRRAGFREGAGTIVRLGGARENPHATLLALARLCLIALLGAALVAGAREGGARSIASVAAAAGTAAALVALWQGAIGFTMQAADIAALESPLRESALARLRSG